MLAPVPVSCDHGPKPAVVPQHLGTAPHHLGTTSGVRPLPTPVRPSSALPASLRAGALAAIGTWAVVVLPALVGWVAAPESSVGWFSAVSVGSGIWFLGHGQSIGAGGVAVSLTPLLLLAVNVYIAYRWARRLAATQRAAVGAAAWSDVALRGVVPGFLGGYLLMAGVFALFTLGGVAAPGFAAVPGALLVPVLALGFVLVRPDDEESPAFVRAVFRRGPTWLPTVWRVGWRGAGLLLAVGAGVVVLRLVMTFPAILSIQSDYGVNLGGAAIVGLAQLALLGNAVTWALGFVAGPGFALALGSTVSPAAAVPGLLPLVPVLGAVPEAADYPPILYAVLLLPIAAGVLIGRGGRPGARVLRQPARPGHGHCRRGPARRRRGRGADRARQRRRRGRPAAGRRGAAAALRRGARRRGGRRRPAVGGLPAAPGAPRAEEARDRHSSEASASEASASRGRPRVGEAHQPAEVSAAQGEAEPAAVGESTP